MLVMIGCWPKLAHLVLVTQTPPCSPPLHSIAVVDERQLWPGGAVVPVLKVSVGNPLPPLPPLPVLVPVAPLPLPLSLPAVVLGLGAGDSKSGGVPVPAVLRAERCWRARAADNVTWLLWVLPRDGRLFGACLLVDILSLFNVIHPTRCPSRLRIRPRSHSRHTYFSPEPLHRKSRTTLQCRRKRSRWRPGWIR